MKLKWIWLVALSVFFLSACEAAPVPSPTLTITPSQTSLPPTATLTPLPTVTRTPTSTPHLEEQGIFIFDTTGENLQRLLIGNYDLPKFTPDGQKILLAESDGEKSDLLVYDRAVGELLLLYSVQGEIKNVEVAPANSLLAMLVEDNQQTSIILFDYQRAIVTNTCLAPEGFILSGPLSWSHDARWLAFSQCVKPDKEYRHECDVYTWEIEREKLPKPISTSAEYSYHPIWSPNDYRLAFLGNGNSLNGVYMIDFQQSLPEYVDLGIASNFDLSWSPNASQLLVDGAMSPYIFDIESETKTKIFDGGLGLYRFLGWLPNGIMIYQGRGPCCSEWNIFFFDPLREESIPPYYSYFTGSWISEISPDLSFTVNEIVFVGIYDPTIHHLWD
jgi:hypothetical protein